MTKIKLCGLMREQDILAANQVMPEYVGFILTEKSRRHISLQRALEFKGQLEPSIKTVGVFLNDDPGAVVSAIRSGAIDMVQLHGDEDDTYISGLRAVTDKPLIKAYVIRSAEDVRRAECSSANFILLDGGMGQGQAFDWSLLRQIRRPYFLAGGLCPENVEQVVRLLRPFAVDVSSGIETNGIKDIKKMTAFVDAVRKEAVI